MYNDNLAFLGLALLLWLLSPIALIIACVRLSRARDKLEKEVERLQKELLARDRAVPADPSEESETSAHDAADSTIAATAAVRAEETRLTMPADSAAVPKTIAHESTNVPMIDATIPETARASAQAPTAKKAVNPLNAVFIVGALFIVTAGIIFASSTWEELGTVPRIAALGSVSVLFFAASILARKRFDLRSTGAVFFTLGSVFLPVSFVAAGLLGLFGPSLTGSGDRVFLLYSGGAFLLGMTALRGSLLYRSKVFAWVCLSSITGIVAFLAASIDRGIPTVSLALALFSAVPVAAIEIAERAGTRLGTFASRLRASPFAGPFKPYAALTVLAASVIAFIGRGVEGGSGITFAVLAVLFLSRIFNDSSQRYRGIGIYPFTLCLTLSVLRFPGVESVPSVAFAAALVMTLGLMGFVPERTRKASGIASFIALAWAAVSAIAYRSEWTIQLLCAVAALSVVVGVRARSEDRAFKSLHPVLIVILAEGVAVFFGHSAPAAYAIAGVAILAMLVAYRPLGLRSRVSDAVFLVALLLDFFILRDRGSVAGQLALFACNLSGVLWVARKESVARYAAPHYAALGFLATAGFFPREGFAAVAWYALLASVAAGERFLRKRIRIREARLACKVAVSLWGAIAVLAGIAGSGLSAYYAIPWIAFAYWLVSYLASDERRIADFWVAGILFLASPLVSAFAITQAQSFPATWAIFAPAVASLALLAPAGIPAIARDPARKTALFALSVGALQIASCAASLAFIDGHALPLSYCAASAILLGVAFTVAYVKGASALSVLPLLLVYPLARRVSPDLLPILSRFSSIKGVALLENLMYCVIFSVCIALSMLLYRTLYEKHDNGRVSVDCFALIAPIGPLALLVTGMDGLVPNAEYWTFAGVALLAVAALLFWQRTGNETVDRTALSVSLACGAAALIVEPFFAIPTIVLDEWRLLIPLAAIIATRRFVWRGKETVLGWIAFAWGCACIAILSWQALESGEAADAIILGVGSLGVFIASFLLRLKRIFVLSAITLIGLGIYLSRDFWVSLAWWIYLLSAGVALISFAIVNESMRKRGSGVASQAGRLFAEWRW